MKRTSSMIYRPSDEAQELYIFANNDRRIYNMMQYVEAALDKKVKKGVYDADRAIDAFYNVMCEASNVYKKAFGYAFTVTERFTAAQDLAQDFMEEMKVQGVIA